MPKKPTRKENAEILAKSHMDFDPGVQQVFLLEGKSERSADEPIKLLEVVEGTMAKEIAPVYFQPDLSRKLFYPLLIVDVSPAAFRRLRANGKVKYRSETWHIGQQLATRQAS